MSDRERRPDDDIIPEYPPLASYPIETRSKPRLDWVDWLLRLVLLVSISTMVYTIVEISGLLP